MRAPQWTRLKPPSLRSRSPTSVGDWIVASVLIVKGEDFKIVNRPSNETRLIC